MALNTQTQVAYQFVAIDNASAILEQIANSLQKIDDLQRSTEALQIGVQNTKQLAQNTEKANKSISKSVISMKSMKKAIDFVTDALAESSSWTENLHMFEVSFGSASDEAYDFAKTIVNAFGTSQNEIIKYAGYFNQIASAIGLAEETTNKFSMALTALGYDIASLYNLSIEQAMEKLQAGVVGQTKPLRTLGMDITATTLDAYLKETMGISSVTSKMLSQADKMLLRTVVIMQQAQSTYGDMAQTINTFANQVKVMQGSISNMKLAIGDLAKSYLAPLVTQIAGFTVALTSIIRAFIPEETETGIESIANAISDVNDELEDTLNKTGLLGFDKFNSLTKSGTDTADITSLLEEEFYQKYEEYMASFNESMKSIENNANKVALAIVQWVFPLSEFNEATGGIDVNLSKVNSLCVLILGSLTAIVSLGIVSRLIEMVSWLTNLKKTLHNVKEIASGLGTTWTVIIAVLAYAYATNEEFRESVNNLISSLLKLVGNVLSALEPILNAVATVLNQIIDTMAPILSGIIDIVSAVITFIDNFGILEGAVYLVIGAFAIWQGMKLLNWMSSLTGSIGLLATALKVDLVKGLAAAAIGWEMMSTKAKIASLIIGTVLAVTLYSGLNAWFETMDKDTKVLAGTITTIIAVLVAATAAWMAYHGTMTMGVAVPVILAAVGAGVAGIKAICDGIQAYANGGYPDKGSIFLANENGPELIANIGGGQAAVYNMPELTNAVYEGTLKTMGAVLPMIKGNDKQIVLNIDGKQFARMIVSDIVGEIKRQNLKLE